MLLAAPAPVKRRHPAAMTDIRDPDFPEGSERLKQYSLAQNTIVDSDGENLAETRGNSQN